MADDDITETDTGEDETDDAEAVLDLNAPDIDLDDDGINVGVSRE